MSPSRLEERIRELCTQIVDAQGDELTAAIAELQTTLHEHAKHIKDLSVATLARLERARKRPAV